MSEKETSKPTGDQHLLQISQSSEVLVTLKYEKGKVVLEGKKLDKAAKIFFGILKDYIDDYIKKQEIEPSEEWIEKQSKELHFYTDWKEGLSLDECEEFIRNLLKEAKEEKNVRKR